MPELEKSCENFAPKTQRTDVWNGSNWCSDPISLHNEKICEIQASSFNKVDNVDAVSSFPTIPLVNFDHQGFPQAPTHGSTSPNLCCAQENCFKHTKQKSCTLKCISPPQTLNLTTNLASLSKKRCVIWMAGFWRFTNAAKPLPSPTNIALRQAYHVVVKTSILTS